MFIHHVNHLNDNEYTPFGDGKNIIANVGGNYQLVSNVCPHQKSLISTQKGQGNRVCPYHGRSFYLDGKPLGDGRLACKNDTPLKSELLYEWNHLLFTLPIELTKFADFSNLKLVEERTDIVTGNAITIMDIFLDVDHIPVVHTGVYDQIGLTNVCEVEWEYFDWGSVQYVPRDTGYADEFESTLLDEDKNNKYGAVWLAVYPGTMIEWQPGAVFITVNGVTENNQTPVKVYKYRDTRYSERNWELNEEIWEKAWAQDKHQASLIVEVCSDNLEEQKLHFRQTLR